MRLKGKPQVRTLVNPTSRRYRNSKHQQNRATSFVSMCGYYIKRSMDQPGKVANPVRGQLNRENKYFPVRVRAWEFGPARRVRPSRPASACSFSVLRLNLVLTHGIPPDFRGGDHLFIPSTAIGSVSILSGYAIAYRWRSLPRVCRHRASSAQGSSSNGCCLSITMDQLMCASLFPHPLYYYWYKAGMLKVSGVMYARRCSSSRVFRTEKS